MSDEQKTTWGQWCRGQISLQFVLTLVLLLATLTRNSTGWVVDLARTNGDTATAVSKLVEQVRDLSARVSDLEQTRLQQNDIIAKEFIRRSELEPRLKAIEDNGREQNMMFRRFMESYRR